MPDPRFFEDLGPVSVAELAALTGAELATPGDGGRKIGGVAVLARAEAGTVTFLADPKFAADLKASGAGACFLPGKARHAAPPGCAVLITATPQAAYVAAALRLHRPRPTADAEPVSRTATLESGVELGHGVVIGPRARIGGGTRIGPGAVIGAGVAIGRDCIIGPNAVIGFALVGDRVKIHAGAVIGEAGFGATGGAKGLIDIPQLGRVILQDGVTIGANSCVDRGAFEDTVIGENTKIDNLVHIAHNVRVGRNCVMAAYTGISGSVVVGDGAAFGGRAGVADHVIVGQGARIAAAAAVMKDVPAGETWGGMPARPLKKWMRETAWVSRMARRPKEGSDV